MSTHRPVTLPGEIIANLKPMKNELEQYLDAKIEEVCRGIMGADTPEKRDAVHYECAALGRFKNAFIAELSKK